jgi:hypothetical protein
MRNKTFRVALGLQTDEVGCKVECIDLNADPLIDSNFKSSLQKTFCGYFVLLATLGFKV